ncbi:MAG: response regulator transcription factor [Bacteroidia bacterium]|nr:response regulator transcription factor [Bacteroidia bacterium]
MKPIKIILVDDHSLIRDAIRAHLSTENYQIIAEAGNGKEALAIMENELPDIVFMDINMPEQDGISTSREIKKKYPQVEIIALSMLQESQYIRQMFEAGAKGYLLKNCSEEDLKQAIEHVLEGKVYYSPEVSDSLIQGFVQPRQNTTAGSVSIKLTNREKEVLALIAQEFSNREIAEKLFISIRTVDAHRRNLLEKTGSKNAAGLTLFALKMGLIDPK